jgi:hypothetical protein
LRNRRSRHDETSIIENIIDGEYSCPMRVVGFNTAEGWSRDVTEEIAARLLDLNAQGLWVPKT